MKTTNYIGVRLITYDRRKLKARWYAKLTVNGKEFKEYADSEQDAAKKYDWLCIKNGLKPKNGFYKPVEK